MSNGKSVSLQKVLKKVEDLENRVKKMEKEISSSSTQEDELDLVARKIIKEEAEMKAKGKKYLTEGQVKKKYGF